MFMPTQISLQTSLRWCRRLLTMILILSNFAATLLADARGVRASDAALFGSLMICLFLVFVLRTRSRKTSGLALNPALSFSR